MFAFGVLDPGRIRNQREQICKCPKKTVTSEMALLYTSNHLTCPLPFKPYLLGLTGTFQVSQQFQTAAINKIICQRNVFFFSTNLEFLPSENHTSSRSAQGTIIPEGVTRLKSNSSPTPQLPHSCYLLLLCDF